MGTGPRKRLSRPASCAAGLECGLAPLFLSHQVKLAPRNLTSKSHQVKLANSKNGGLLNAMALMARIQPGFGVSTKQLPELSLIKRIRLGIQVQMKGLASMAILQQKPN